jgi:hypothetical protein
MTDEQKELDPVEVAAEKPKEEEWQKYFKEEDTPPPQPVQSVDFEPVQQTPIKSPYVRGGSILTVCIIGCGLLAAGGGALLGIGQDKPQPVAAAPKQDKFGSVPVICNPEQLKQKMCDLKGHLVFDRQGNEDDKFKRGNPKKPTVVKAKVPKHLSTPQSYSTASAPEPRYVAPVRNLPVAAKSTPSPSFVPHYNPPIQRQKADPNAEWARMAQASTYNVEGAYQAPEVAQADAGQVQNVADWQSVQGVQGVQGTQMAMANPYPTLGKTIAMGTKATATLQVPVAAGASGQQTVLMLDDDIKTSGAIVLPKGTLLVASVQSEGSSINLSVSEAYINGQHIAVPGSSVAVSRTNGKPLSAESTQKRGGFGSFARDFALSAVGGAADTLLSSAGSTTVSNGATTTVFNNVGRSFTNTAMGAARGGVQSLINNIQSSNQQGLQGEPVAGLKAGSRVRLYFMSETPI